MRFAKLLAVLLLAAAARAPAIDLTGTWVTAKQPRCTVLFVSGELVPGAVLPSIDIDQNGEDLLANFPSLAGIPADGRVVSDSKKDVGRGHLAACDPLPQFLHLDAFLIRSAKTFPPNRAGVSGKMIVEYVSHHEGSLLVCKKVVLLRTSTTPGLLTLCP
jgi:hypothetical protein